jgi:hypothetical protein
MSKKDLASVTTNLSALAAGLPIQRSVASAAPPAASVVPTAPVKLVAPVESKAKEKAKAKPTVEELTQFSLSLRKSLRKQLGRLADDADMTMRAFVLNALKEKRGSTCTTTISPIYGRSAVNWLFLRSRASTHSRTPRRPLETS